MTMFNYIKTTDSGTETNSVKLVTHIVIGAILAIVALILLFGSWTIVAPTEQNVVLRLGQIDRTLPSGFHWKMPWFDDVVKMDISVQDIKVNASAASADLQIVSTNLVVQLEIREDKVGEIYKEYKRNIRGIVIDPAIQNAIKASTALFEAGDLVKNRPQVIEHVKLLLTERLSLVGVTVRNVDIVDFDFSDSFNSAIEAKVTAEQRALEAENKLAQVEFEAQQRIAIAEAEAEAIRIQAQAINSQGGEDFVQLKAVEKWNGVLPQQFVPGSAVPFLNLIK